MIAKEGGERDADEEDLLQGVSCDDVAGFALYECMGNSPCEYLQFNTVASIRPFYG